MIEGVWLAASICGVAVSIITISDALAGLRISQIHGLNLLNMEIRYQIGGGLFVLVYFVINTVIGVFTITESPTMASHVAELVVVGNILIVLSLTIAGFGRRWLLIRVPAKYPALPAPDATADAENTAVTAPANAPDQKPAEEEGASS